MSGRRRRFDGLNEMQQDALGQIAMGIAWGHHPATVRSLMKRGLVEEQEVELPGDPRFPVRIRVYRMPLHEHMRWCQWCAENAPLPEVDA